MTQIVSSVAWQTGDGTCGLSLEGDLLCKADVAVDDFSTLKTSPRLTRFLGNHDSRCTLDEADIAYCWGPNADHRVLPGGPKEVKRPTAIDGYRWKSLSMGNHRTCGLPIYSNDIVCWGKDPIELQAAGSAESPLEDGLNYPLVATDVVWREVAIGNNDRADDTLFFGSEVLCGLTDQDKLYCYNLDISYSTELFSEDTSGWLTIRVGAGKVCGLTTRKTIECIEFFVLPHQVFAGPWIAFERDNQTACGIKADTSLWCWEFIPGSGKIYSHVEPELREMKWQNMHVDSGICATKQDGAMYCISIPSIESNVLNSDIEYFSTPQLIDGKETVAK